MNDDPKTVFSSVDSGLCPAPISEQTDAVLAVALATHPSVDNLRDQLDEAYRAWLSRSPSVETRLGYARDLAHFLRFHCIAHGAWERLPGIRPSHVAAWRDELLASGYTNTAVSRKLSVLRSLFSYLRAYGYTGPNPADTTFVSVPPVPRDGKTVGLTPEDCRRLLDAPPAITPEGLRDRAIFAVLAYTGCRVGELCRLRVGDYKTTSGHRVLEVRGKGGKERRVPLHAEGCERLDAWIAHAGVQDADSSPLFRPTVTARGRGFDGFHGLEELEEGLRSQIYDALTHRNLALKHGMAARNRDPVQALSYLRAAAIQGRTAKALEEARHEMLMDDLEALDVVHQLSTDIQRRLAARAVAALPAAERGAPKGVSAPSENPQKQPRFDTDYAPRAAAVNGKN